MKAYEGSRIKGKLSPRDNARTVIDSMNYYSRYDEYGKVPTIAGGEEQLDRIKEYNMERFAELAVSVLMGNDESELEAHCADEEYDIVTSIEEADEQSLNDQAYKDALLQGSSYERLLARPISCFVSYVPAINGKANGIKFGKTYHIDKEIVFLCTFYEEGSVEISVSEKFKVELEAENVAKVSKVVTDIFEKVVKREKERNKYSI